MKRRLVPESEKSGCLDFSSNDYLGLSDGAFGAEGSRLLGGNYALFESIESQIASDLDREACLIFNSGYHANVGVLSTLFGPDDVIFADKLCHASMIDGIRLSGAKLYRYKHCDSDHLETLLGAHRHSYKKAVIVTESVFSMEGDVADLKTLEQLKQRFDTQLMVDDAHAIGVFGPQGLGLGNTVSADIIVGTFGKALGSCGAYVACSKGDQDYLVNYCRSFIYSTALPKPVMAWNLEKWGLMKRMDQQREELLDLSRYLRESLSQTYTVLGSTHIVPVVIGEEPKTLALSEQLKAGGVWAPPIRPPTVHKMQCRLRFSVTLGFSRDDMDKVIDVLLNA